MPPDFRANGRIDPLWEVEYTIGLQTGLLEFHALIGFYYRPTPSE